MYIMRVCAILHAIFLADYFVGSKALSLLQTFIPMFVYLGYIVLAALLDIVFSRKK